MDEDELLEKAYEESLVYMLSNEDWNDYCDGLHWELARVDRSMKERAAKQDIPREWALIKYDRGKIMAKKKSKLPLESARDNSSDKPPIFHTPMKGISYVIPDAPGCDSKRYMTKEGIEKSRDFYLGIEPVDDKGKPALSDPIHPSYYNQDGVQPIDLIEAMGFGKGFCLGSAIKYLARCDKKHDTLECKIADLDKALYYIERAKRHLK